MSSLGKKNDGRHGGLKVQLVGQSDDHRMEVRDALAALGDPVLNINEIEPDPDAATDLNFDVTMVVFNGNDELSLSYLNTRAGQEPRPALFALLHDRSPELMKRVLRAGADELLFLPLDPGDATRALLKISETRRREEVHVGGGTIVSLVSLIGGTGVTSLAANLALALRYAFDKRVAVVDLDLQTGGLSVFLNLEPERTIMTLTEGTRKLDSIQLESALSKHASGIYLLAAPKRIEDSELVTDVTVALLAQVDSSIGGKVGVDLPQGKNLVGAFYPPRLVLADPALLLTLPQRQFVEGWAECVKLGVALDDDYFAFLEAHTDALLRLEPDLLCEAIARAVAIKAAIVERDEGEQGERALLNYGHTLGHAIEQVTGYARWLHGEAVSIGMAFAARLGHRIGVTPAELIERQDALLERMGLPARADGLPLDGLFKAMTRDKKARDGEIRWVIPTALGQSALMAVSTEDVRAALLDFRATDAPVSDGPQTIGAADAQ